MQQQSGGVVTSASAALLFPCCLWRGIWLEVQELHQQMQPEGKKLFLLSLMDVLHNLVTTVEKTITPGLLSNLVTVSGCQSPNCQPGQMSSQGRAAGAGDALTRCAPGGPGSPAVSLCRGHQRFPDSLTKGWRRFSPRAAMRALSESLAERLRSSRLQDDKRRDSFCVVLSVPGAAGTRA